jgi:hypothetical protein
MARPSLLLALLVTVWVCAAPARADPLLERFERWMGRHGRLYADAGEKQRRLEVYRRNVELVERFNSMGNGGYRLADTRFADLTNEEFRTKMLGLGPRSRAGRTTAPSTMTRVCILPLAASDRSNIDSIWSYFF